MFYTIYENKYLHREKRGHSSQLRSTEVEDTAISGQLRCLFAKLYKRYNVKRFICYCQYYLKNTLIALYIN